MSRNLWPGTDFAHDCQSVPCPEPGSSFEFLYCGTRPALNEGFGPDRGEAYACLRSLQSAKHFSLNPRGVIGEVASARAVLLLRVEDLIRFELVSLDTSSATACVRAFRERTEQFVQVLERVSQLQLTLMMCPPGMGAYNVEFLGNVIRVTEHKIAAALRAQQRHLVINWEEFERACRPEKCFNPSADRLGHVPFSPEGLEALAAFLMQQLAPHAHNSAAQ